MPFAVEAVFCGNNGGVNGLAGAQARGSGGLGGNDGVHRAFLRGIVAAFVVRNGGGVAVRIVAGPSEALEYPIMAERRELHRSGIGVGISAELNSGGIFRAAGLFALG